MLTVLGAISDYWSLYDAGLKCARQTAPPHHGVICDAGRACFFVCRDCGAAYAAA